MLISAFVLSLAHPSFLSKTGFGFLAFISLIPVFAVIKNTSWKLVGAYGFLYGFVYYSIFNYWLTTFHPLAILIVTIIKGTEMIPLYPPNIFSKINYLLQKIAAALKARRLQNISQTLKLVNTTFYLNRTKIPPGTAGGPPICLCRG